MTKRERLARVVWEIMGEMEPNSLTFEEAVQHKHLCEAIDYGIDAILDALREPSEGMLEASGLGALTEAARTAIWQAMIDHILNEEA